MASGSRDAPTMATERGWKKGRMEAARLVMGEGGDCMGQSFDAMFGVRDLGLSLAPRDPHAKERDESPDDLQCAQALAHREPAEDERDDRHEVGVDGGPRPA